MGVDVGGIFCSASQMSKTRLQFRFADKLIYNAEQARREAKVVDVGKDWFMCKQCCRKETLLSLIYSMFNHPSYEVDEHIETAV
jgi:hypothetical protein